MTQSNFSSCGIAKNNLRNLFLGDLFVKMELNGEAMWKRSFEFEYRELQTTLASLGLKLERGFCKPASICLGLAFQPS